MSDPVLSFIIRGKDEGSAALKQVGGASNDLESKLKSLAKVAAGAFAALAVTKTIEEAVASTQALGESVRKLSMQTGLSAEQSSHFIFMLKETGLAAEDAEKAMGIFAKGVDTHSKTVTGALEKIGVSATDAQGHFKSVNDLIPEISDHFRLLADGSEKTAIAMELFGRSGKDMIPFLNLGSVEMKKMADEADRLGVTLSAQNVESIHKYTMAQREMGEAIEGVKVKIGLALIPALTEGAQGMTHLLEKNKEAIDNFTSGIPGAIEVTVQGVKTFGQGIETAAEDMGHLVGVSGDLTAAMVPLAIAMAFLFPEGALVVGIAAVHETFTILDSDTAKASDSALTFESAWLTAVQNILSGLDDMETGLLNIITLGNADILGETAPQKAMDAISKKQMAIGAERISRGGIPLDVQQKIAFDPAAAADFNKWIAATGDNAKKAGVGVEDLATGLGGSGGLTAAAQRADQGLIDMALAFADFHAATGKGVEDFMALVDKQHDLADVQSRGVDAAIMLKKNELEAADAGFQLQKALVGIAEDAAKSGRTIAQESAHLWQGIVSGIQSAFSALNGSQTREGAQLQLQIDKAQLDYDNASRHGANQAELTALQKHIQSLQEEQKVRDDNTRIQKDLFDIANQMLPTDRQKLLEETMYIAAQHDATTTLLDVTATAALQQIAQENYINALGNASGALGGASAADPFNAAQKHWINGVAIGKGEPLPYPGFASGTPYVPYTGLAMVHQGERIIPADQNRAGGGGPHNYYIDKVILQGDPSAGLAALGAAI